eukprot:3271641-Rhodomonas_salina.1
MFHDQRFSVHDPRSRDPRLNGDLWSVHRVLRDSRPVAPWFVVNALWLMGCASSFVLRDFLSRSRSSGP